MTKNTDRLIAPFMGTTMLTRPFSGFRLPEPVFSPDADGNPTAEETAAAEKAAADKAAADKAKADADKAEADRLAALKTKSTDELITLLAASEKEKADLLKETMSRKERIKTLETDMEKFKGIDPEAYKAAMDEKAALETAAAEAKKKELAAEGKWQELLDMKDAEHQRTVEAQKAEHLRIVGEKEAEITSLKAAGQTYVTTIEELTIGQNFANSTYIREDLLLTPLKARQLYGAHFENEGGKTVGYNKPRGVEGRTKLVTATGEPMPFDEAFKRIIDADPDKDTLLKVKINPGAGTRHQSGTKAAEKKGETGLRGAARILAGLKADANS